MGQIRLIATDIDGTILPFGQTSLSERMKTALSGAMQKGVYVVPASGRLLSSIPKDLLALPGIRYVMASNGAVIYDLKSGEAIYRREIPPFRAAQILRLLEERDTYSSAYIRDVPCNRSRLHPGLAIRYSYRLDFFRRNPKEDLPRFVEENGEPVEKIFVAVFDSAVREAVRKELAQIPGIRVTTSSSWNLEINQEEAEKGTALAWLCRKLEIPRSQVVAMGDNENDLSMLSFAGRSVVPANALPPVQAIATEVVPECELGGTALFIERELELSDSPSSESMSGPKAQQAAC